MSLTVPFAADVAVVASGPFHHRCPFVDEADDGWVDISWRCNGQTLELHALADWLAKFKDSEISHEAITDTLTRVLGGLDGIEDVTVATRWETAGMTVTVTGGAHEVLRQPELTEGA